MSHEDRPWGTFYVIGDFADCKIKRIVVKPLQRLSLQSHHFRQEEWIVLHGQGYAQLNEEMIELCRGKHVTIPRTTKHRLINSHESLSLVLIEVQTGDYFGEDDIVRYEDDFGRV